MGTSAGRKIGARLLFHQFLVVPEIPVMRDEIGKIVPALDHNRAASRLSNPTAGSILWRPFDLAT